MLIGSSLSYASEGESHGMKMENSSGKHEMAMEKPTSGIFSGEGKIISIMVPISKVVISHTDVEGYMKGMPMGMGYAVKSRDMLKNIKPGDEVNFKIDASNEKIVELEKK